MHDTLGMKMIRTPLFALLAAAAVFPASAGTRSAEPTTKLQRCGDQTCLLVSGRRADPAAKVVIEHHEVAVSGAKRWRVSLPLQTVRNWSAPAARSILVEIDGNQAQALLPIGVFGGTTNLAFLSVSAL